MYETEERAAALYRDSQTNEQWLSEALDQYASAYGAEAPDREWICTPYDTWERNPFFTGTPSGRHPEDDEREWEGEE